MQYSQGSIGRIFTLRLEEDERVPDCIEQFARDHDIKTAMCTLIGGVDRGNIVAGPKDGESPVIDPFFMPSARRTKFWLWAPCFPTNPANRSCTCTPHWAATARPAPAASAPASTSGWWGEVIIMEILHTDMLRKKEAKSGLALLCKG